MGRFILILLVMSYLTKASTDSTKLSNTLNMDAIYNRPYITEKGASTSIGGYISANYFRDVEDGISEGHSFSVPRLTLFLNSNISSNIHFTTEIEFEEGGNEIAIEYAALDIILDELLVLRGGIVMNPIGSFNQNHDDPKWEFNRRPVYATQLLPVTFSSAGFGIYGKGHSNNWTLGYEAYLTNGFDESIIDNPQSKTYLPAVKSSFERFEESSNGKPLFTGKVSIKNRDFGEFGVSAMFGDYNISVKDGIELAHSRGMSVIAFDYNNIIPYMETKVITEVAFINVDVPDSYFGQYGEKQFGLYADLVQSIGNFNLLNFQNIETNIALRLDYADWNVGKFSQTGQNVGNEYFALTPAISLRPDPNTVIRFNYSYAWVTDFLGNEPSEISSIIIGLSTYF